MLNGSRGIKELTEHFKQIQLKIGEVQVNSQKIKETQENWKKFKEINTFIV